MEDPHTSDHMAPRLQRHRRAAPSFSGPALAQEIGIENNRGTNIQHIALDRPDRMVVSQRQPWSPGWDRDHRDPLLERPLLESSGREPADSSTLPMLVGVAGLVLLICLIAIIVILLLRRKKREKESHFPPYASSSSSAYHGYSHGSAGMWSSSDSSEV